ncbi:hypothetical protein PV05_03993 [Exophiala xenobiotica]|uniref:Uncharacterized protein n=1 Tax=Exophiala xenobiotica TaxID=348802 RepID=A0A0D2EXW9_9EURO|nr:uncharacterized protein PV05_03993 [Exophiala xenobiotica]KIW59550.1 hypothetical protein PV05_03993 [Exophiala xenobiotica]
MSYYNKLDSQGAFENAVVQLYSRILEYQAHMVCHLSHNTAKRGWSNIIKPGHWADLPAAVKNADQECQQYASFLDKTAERELLQEQTLQIERSTKVQRQILDALSDIEKVRAAERDDDLLKDFLQSFSTDYEGDKDINTKRVPGTCQWFLDHKRFQTWRDSPTSALLWVSAGPGCGKSVLSRCLVDERLLTNSRMTSTVCYFFFKDGLDGRDQAENALTAMLHQLYTHNLDKNLITHALSRFKENGTSLRSMLSKLWAILVETAKNPASGEIVCILDALDEFHETSRSALMEMLVDFFSDPLLTQNPNIRLKFLITSRPYDDIELEFSRLQDASIFLQFAGDDQSERISEEINLVIDHRVPRVLPKLDSQSRTTIVERLKKLKHRTYLWLHLILAVIQKEFVNHCTAQKLQTVIDKLPSSVSEAYEAILGKTTDPRQARFIFQIILVAKRVLTVPEIKVALELAKRIDAESLKDLDLPTDAVFTSTLPKICGLFVSIHDDRVYLIRQTAREFLIHGSGRNTLTEGAPPQAPTWQHSIDLSDAELLLAKVCVAFLKFRDFRNLPWLEDNRTRWFEWEEKYGAQVQDRVFLDYSATSWFSHYRAVQATLDPGLITSALEHCQPNEKLYRVWYALYCSSRRWNISYDETNLTITSTLGLRELILRLLRAELQDRSDVDEESAGSGTNISLSVNRRGGEYGNALIAASAGGHTDVVGILIANGADVNAQGRWGTALQWASRYSHEKIVQILVDNGADVNARGYFEVGHEKVVQILVDNGAVMNA